MMQLIDEEGRFLGHVNVIDALVVLLVVSMITAGIALVTTGPDNSDRMGDPEDGPTATRYD